MEWALYGLLLLACPLIMLWCMRGMGRSSDSHDQPVEQMTPQAAKARLAEVQREELRLQERLLENDPARSTKPH